MAKRDSVARLKHELAQVKQRLSWVEKAIRREPVKERIRDGNAEVARDLARATASRKAIDEFCEQRRRRRYEEFPDLLQERRKFEKDVNAFLRERGLDPIPTEIPKRLSRSRKSS